MALPLEGVKVLDLSNIMAGPYCTMVLGDMRSEEHTSELQSHHDLVCRIIRSEGVV